MGIHYGCYCSFRFFPFPVIRIPRLTRPVRGNLRHSIPWCKLSSRRQRKTNELRSSTPGSSQRRCSSHPSPNHHCDSSANCVPWRISTRSTNSRFCCNGLCRIDAWILQGAAHCGGLCLSTNAIRAGRESIFPHGPRRTWCQLNLWFGEFQRSQWAEWFRNWSVGTVHSSHNRWNRRP
jgi:hypothetical protein